MISVIWLLFIFGCVQAQFLCSQFNDTAIVRQIDHVPLGAVTNSSKTLKTAFAIFTNVLHFPIAWDFLNYEGTVKGGVSVGNVNLELFYTGTSKGFAGLAFDPCFENNLTMSRLQNRGIPSEMNHHSGIIPQGYTTFSLPSLSNGDLFAAFLCKYDFFESERRETLWKRLLDAKGGPLGVLFAFEISLLVGPTSSAIAQAKRYQQLLSPLSNPDCTTQACVWSSFEGGPSLVIMNKTAHLQSMSPQTNSSQGELADGCDCELGSVALKVLSLNQAESYLQKYNLLGPPPEKGSRYEGCVTLSLESYGTSTVPIYLCQI